MTLKGRKTTQIKTPKGYSLIYDFIPGSSPVVMFLGGFHSHMQGKKASYLAQHCQKKGQAFLRFNYQGHGESLGNPEDGSFPSWIDDGRLILTQISHQPHLLVGSSMGSWIMMLLARENHSKIKGMISIACAVDFFHELIWDYFDQDTKADLKAHPEKKHPIPTSGHDPLSFSYKMIQQAEPFRLLNSPPFTFNHPVRFIHGLKDQEVPWNFSLKASELITSKKVRVDLIKDGDHQLSQPQDLLHLGNTVDEMSQIINNS